MSGEKEPFDNYPTPDQLAKAIVKRLREMYGPRRLLVEPSAGNGVFVRHMREAWNPDVAAIWAVDIRDEKSAVLGAGASYFHQGDWVEWVRLIAASKSAGWGTEVPLLIGNPPFSLAQAHLEASFKHLPLRSNICFLLRYGFLGGKDRTKTFWQVAGGQFLRHLIPIAPRPSFVKGKNDNSEYAVFIWEVGYDGPATVLPHILWEKRVRPVK